MPMAAQIRSAVKRVAALEFGFFTVEAGIALAIGSVALIADSIDFLEDASINLLIFVALGWSLAARARLGMVLAAILLIPTIATLWVAWQKFGTPIPPAALPLTLTGIAALFVNAISAFWLAKFRACGGSMVKAAFLSARNDMIANLGIIGAGLLTAWSASAWPDLAVGVAVALLNIGAAKEVWEAANAERREALVQAEAPV